MAKRSKSSSLYSSLLLCLVILGTSALFFMPTAVMLMVGMLPSFIALVTDDSKERMAGMTVGLMNFAGLLPYLIELWRGSHTMDTALDLVMNFRVLAVVYLAAGVGWVLYLQLPILVAQLSLSRAQRRVNDIKQRISDLEKTWGGSLDGSSTAEDTKTTADNTEEDSGKKIPL